ncbi:MULTISPECIES: transcription repressor NadR [unclassified Psychrobacillus]|uniref:transcription repressor NadR n=1 Tax=unclassified Psychrobacillus TaxID=2636677 RepID=UPI00146D836E|nr:MULTISPECIES: transcription repressor NadR [unclassified Psychrobacillus]MCM3358483.1 transcription repressor NadR [Psychrobacillus sp. MER TA 171]NME04219.1 transcription repressor NadR [Psychrobacillus sp. BL-248-WT-3]
MKKLKGAARREWILTYLKEQDSPITGADLAKLTNVSRQVIVSDITLLKAINHPILSTSQGYILLPNQEESNFVKRKIACNHKSEDTKDELLTLVDAGVTVESVTVEHPVYGEITSSIMVSNRHDVENFLKKVQETEASFLLELTAGLHIHLLSAPNEQILQRGITAIREKGYVFEG